MAYHRTSPATEPVRRYLLQMIAKSGPEPERLISERDLAEKLRLSRVTVRRAIEELEEIQYIIRLPGRKGAFTNPAMSSMVDHCIGLVVSQNYIGQIFSQFIGGITNELYAQRYAYNFSLFNYRRNAPEDVAFELENSGYDCLVWHTQAPEDLEVIELLLEHDFPVLTICNPNYPEWGHPSRGWYGLDNDFAGRTLASYFIREQCGNIVYCSDNTVFLSSFRDELAKHGILLPDNNILQDENDLPTLLASGTDGLCCLQSQSQTKILLDLISRQEHGNKLKILLPPSMNSERHRKEYPNLHIILPDTDYYQRQCLALGEEVARGIIGVLNGKQSAPEGVLLKSYF